MAGQLTLQAADPTADLRAPLALPDLVPHLLLLVPVVADHAVWNAPVAAFAESVARATGSDPGLGRARVLVSGTLSERAREEMHGLAIDVTERALEAAGDPSIGVVILDIQLPDQSGLEVFRQLRDTRPDLRVIILSAHTDQETVLEALRLGAFDYLAKPIHEEELALAVRRALETFGIASGWSRLRRRIGLRRWIGWR